LALLLGDRVDAGSDAAAVGGERPEAKLGTLGIFVPGLTIVGAHRLAAPESLWAHHFYSRAKLARSRLRTERRDQRYTHLRHRLYDLIGGRPHLEREQRPLVKRLPS
jgi:hypothetical protein